MPQLLSHLISPRELWQTTDVTMGIGFFILPIIYGCLMVLPKLDHNCKIFQIVDKHDHRRIVMLCNGKANIVLLFYFTLGAQYINIKLKYQAEKLFKLVSKLNKT
ncbi:hypothetical protein TYRP_016356 [Tyrophagus putrescentiae]|nr:hypothetical protein TYRP_016356 [Tyrophagus putrescentiae]